MSAESKKYTVHQGEDFNLSLTWEDGNGTPFLLADYTEVKLLLFPQGSTTPQEFIGAGLDTEPNISIDLTDTETLALDPGLYEAKIKLTSSGGLIYIIPDGGNIKILVKEIT